MSAVLKLGAVWLLVAVACASAGGAENSLSVGAADPAWGRCTPGEPVYVVVYREDCTGQNFIEFTHGASPTHSDVWDYANREYCDRTFRTQHLIELKRFLNDRYLKARDVELRIELPLEIAYKEDERVEPQPDVIHRDPVWGDGERSPEPEPLDSTWKIGDASGVLEWRDATELALVLPGGVEMTAERAVLLRDMLEEYAGRADNE